MQTSRRSLIDRPSRVHPLTPALLWTPLAVWLAWRSYASGQVSGEAFVVLAMAGLIVWSSKRSRVAATAVLSIALLLLAAVAWAGEWEKVSDKGGLLIERRPIPGSHLFEVRATVQSPLPPGAIFDTLWNHRDYPTFVPHLKKLDLLSDTDDEHLVYEQVAVPLARDSDYTVRLRKQVDAAAQRYGIKFMTANDAGPPPDGSHVRVRKIEGSWSIELGADGKGSVLRYDVRTEPGGTIPTFVTNLAQREAVANLVHAVLKRASTTYSTDIKKASER